MIELMFLMLFDSHISTQYEDSILLTQENARLDPGVRIILRFRNLVMIT